MGFKLRREVRDAIPPGKLSAAERLLVLELADWCNDKTRKGWPGAELLAELTDLSPRSIQETLSRVAAKWIELRVPLGTDKTGKPYYSHAGRRTTFEFPKLTPVKGAIDQGACDATDPGASDDEGATDPGGRCDESVPKVRQIRGPSPQGTSSKKPSNPSPLPPSDTDASTEPEPDTGKEGEDGEFDSDQEQRINTLVAEILDLRPNNRRWTAKSIRAAIDKCLTDGKPLDEIERAFPACAADPDTGAPGRLPLDFYWWALPEPEVPLPRCGHCEDRGTVTVRNPYEGDSAKEVDCEHCNTRADGRCRHHPHHLAHACGLCRADRLAAGVERPKDRQPRSGERQPSTGDRKLADAMRLGDELDAQHGYTPRSASNNRQHQPYRNPPVEEYDQWHTRRPPAARGQHVPYLDPEDLSVYDKPL